jgi:tetratricopeptide (TPR) repeat protein
MMLGSLLAEFGNIDQAISHLKEAVHINNKNATAYILLTHIYKATNNATMMLDTLHTGVNNCPDDLETNILISDVLLEEKDFGGAKKYLLIAYSIAPNDIDVVRKLGYAYHCMGNLEEANKYFKAGYEMDSTDPICICGLADTYAKLDKAEDSIAVAKQGYKIKPDDNNILHSYALALLANKRFNDALATINKAIDLDPDSLSHPLLKADIYERSGDYERAFDIIKPHLESRPPLLEAILIFARFCANVSMADECIALLDISKNDKNNSNNISVIDDAISWLRTNS